MKYFTSLMFGLVVFFLYNRMSNAQTPIVTKTLIINEMFDSTEVTAQAVPTVTVTLATEDVGDGDIFIAQANWIMIIDNSGNTVFTRYVNDVTNSGTDFKRQGDCLTYFVNTDDSVLGAGFGYYQVLDLDYTAVATYTTVGLEADLHDFQLFDNGHALLLAYNPRTVDMTTYGGVMSATVYSCVIQEVDENGNLVWAWDSWDHTPITHTNQSLTTSLVDYDHCNAVEQDNDGNVLLSSRHLDTITKIDRTTGDILWRLGGVANDFTFTNDSGFALQHDIRRLDNGRITLFDNNTAARGYSRAVEYEIDEINMVITRTWEYTGPFAFCCSNVQTLDNGNKFINWGPAHPTVTEVTSDGTPVFIMDTQAGSYRGFRFPANRVYYLPLIFKSNSLS